MKKILPCLAALALAVLTTAHAKQPVKQGEIKPPPPPPAKMDVKATPSAEEPLSSTYLIYGGGRVQFIGGDRAFATKVVDATMKNELNPQGNPQAALGRPDCVLKDDKGYYSIGCRGELVLNFENIPITEGPGPDFYIMEVGDAPEPADLFLSVDGEDWLWVGVTTGGVEPIDITGRVAPKTAYQFLKIRDLGDRCYGTQPGADIDAVAAVWRLQEIPPPLTPAAPVERAVLSGSVAFEFGKAVLTEEGKSELGRYVQKISGGKYLVTVEGHTDSVGSDEYNQRLSEERAKAVADYLTAQARLPSDAIRVQGFGKTRPRENNATSEGRAKNRRVELVFRPGKD